MPHQRRVAWAAVLILLASLVASCGGDQKRASSATQQPATTATQRAALLDTPRVESELKRELTGPVLAPVISGRQTKTSRTVTSVTCPREVERQPGNTFSCQVSGLLESEVAGKTTETGTISVTQKDSEGKLLRYSATLKNPGGEGTQEGEIKLK